MMICQSWRCWILLTPSHDDCAVAERKHLVTRGLLLCTSFEVYMTTSDVSRYVLPNDVLLAARTAAVVRDQLTTLPNFVHFDRCYVK